MANSPEPFGRMIEPIEFYKITCPQPSPHLGEGMGRGRNFETTPRNLRVAVGNWQTTLGHEIALDGDTESPQSLPEISPPFGGGTPFSSRGFRLDSPFLKSNFFSFFAHQLSIGSCIGIRKKISRFTCRFREIWGQSLGHFGAPPYGNRHVDARRRASTASRGLFERSSPYSFRRSHSLPLEGVRLGVWGKFGVVSKPMPPKLKHNIEF